MGRLSLKQKRKVTVMPIMKYCYLGRVRLLLKGLAKAIKRVIGMVITKGIWKLIRMVKAKGLSLGRVSGRGLMTVNGI